MINGHTVIIPHIGYPTHSFKAPLIYNPYFEQQGINALVVPMACQPDNFADLLRSLFRLGNIAGALITMPHKVSTVGLVDEVLPAAAIAGAANAVRLGPQGQLQADMFDGEGFVRGVLRKGLQLAGERALVVGSGGVGCAIAASLAAAGVAELALFDVNTTSSQALAERLNMHYPQLRVQTGSKDPAGFDLVVNATPLGMNEGDPLPLDMDRLSPSTFVGEVVMRTDMTAFLSAAQARGCRVQIGSDMLFEQIPAYLEFFGLPSTSAEVLRSLARL
ncbi:MAG: ThiF family adenylyltransferase [Betaproteobacteria bacterium]